VTDADDSRAMHATARRDRSAFPERPARPAHLRVRFLALVALGGTVGTALREGLTLAIPPLGSLPLATFLINVTGAFVLGLLLEVLARRGPDEGRRRAVRLLVGTGVLGGFTTYSALAAVTAELGVAGDWIWAIAYPLGTIVVGAAASIAGIAVGTRMSRTAEEASVRRAEDGAA
jgi:CrcB protein